LVVLTFMNFTLENSDATLVDLLNDVKNKLAEMQAGEVKLQKEIDALVKNGIVATGIEEEVHEVDETVEIILHHVAGSDDGTTTTTGPESMPTTEPTTRPTTRPTTSEMLIVDSGTPGASSSNLPRFPPKLAFLGRGTKGTQWLNAANQFPALIWMRFSKPHRLAKISFTSPYVNDSPRNIGFIGSEDCSHWTSLLDVEDAGFTNDWESKTWSIPPENRLPFQCIGISWPNRGKGDLYARITDIKMWEEL